MNAFAHEVPRSSTRTTNQLAVNFAPELQQYSLARPMRADTKAETMNRQPTGEDQTGGSDMHVIYLPEPGAVLDVLHFLLESVSGDSATKGRYVLAGCEDAVVLRLMIAGEGLARDHQVALSDLVQDLRAKIEKGAREPQNFRSNGPGSTHHSLRLADSAHGRERSSGVADFDNWAQR